MTDIQRYFIHNLKYYRKKAKLSQQDLSEKCDLSPGYIGDIEYGRRFPSAEVLQKLCDQLQILPYRLFYQPSIEIVDNDAQDNEVLYKTKEALKNMIDIQLDLILKKEKDS